jgi:type IV secretory pathway VirB2 component (pilin)
MPEAEQEPTEREVSPKEEIAATVVETLGEDADAVEAKRNIALTVLRSLDSRTQKDVVRELQLLPAEQRKAIANSLMPTQPVTDWIWKVTVGVFASVLVLATLALCAGALWFKGDVQTLLTVVTTVAGILAGFISGRASSGGTPS